MSWIACAFIKRCRLGGGDRKAVALVLADYATEDGSAVGVDVPEGWSVCWATQSTLAGDSEVPERTVRQYLKEFEAAGLIRREHRGRRGPGGGDGAGGGRTSDLIWLEWSRLPVKITKGDQRETDRDDQAGKIPAAAAGNSVCAGPGDGQPAPGPVLEAVDNRPAGGGVTGSTEQGYRQQGPGVTGSSSAGELPREPTTNHQDHLGRSTTDRAGARKPNPDDPPVAGPGGAEAPTAPGRLAALAAANRIRSRRHTTGVTERAPPDSRAG